MTVLRLTPYSGAPLNPTSGIGKRQLSKASSADRVVRKKLADGTTKEYRYPRNPPAKARRIAPDSVGAMLAAYRRSPQWASLAPRSKAHYGHYLRHLEEAWTLPVAQVSRRLLLSMMDAVASEYGPAAANAFIRATRAALSWARDREWIEYSVADRIKSLPIGEHMAWTWPQVEVALEKFPEPLRRVVVLGVYIGQRRGDLCAMPWSAYDGSTVRLTQEKTGAELVIPVHPVLKAELDRWRQSRTSTMILTTETGLPWAPAYLSAKMATEVRRAGLPAGLSCHGLRKCAAAMLADAGCSTHEIAAITGHKSLAQVQLYTRSADQRRMATAAILRWQIGPKTA
jgi:integrase